MGFEFRYIVFYFFEPEWAALAWVRWVQPNPSIARRGFSNPSIFEKKSRKKAKIGRSRADFGNNKYI